MLNTQTILWQWIKSKKWTRYTGESLTHFIVLKGQLKSLCPWQSSPSLLGCHTCLNHCCDLQNPRHLEVIQNHLHFSCKSVTKFQTCYFQLKSIQFFFKLHLFLRLLLSTLLSVLAVASLATGQSTSCVTMCYKFNFFFFFCFYFFFFYYYFIH